MELSKEKQLLLEKIKEYEKKEMFDVDVNEDPIAPILMPDQVDYECKKLSNKFKRSIANFMADRYFKKLIKKDILVIDGIENEHILKDALKNGAIITCNHFSAFDNYIIFHCIRKYLPKKYLYKVIREGNYTNFPGLYGFFFKHCNTLPLSSNMHTMKKFLKATNNLLTSGESILIYPEQAMWWNYKKPRPFKIGGFKMAYKANVPVLPLFISMKDDDRLDQDGYPIQRHTLHVLEPIYPDKTLTEKEGSTKLMNQAYNRCKVKYEEVYGEKLTYGKK